MHASVFDIYDYIYECITIGSSISVCCANGHCYYLEIERADPGVKETLVLPPFPKCGILSNLMVVSKKLISKERVSSVVLLETNFFVLKTSLPWDSLIQVD